MRLVVSMLCTLVLATPLRVLATTQITDAVVVEGGKGALYGSLPEVPFVSMGWRMKRPQGVADPELAAADARLKPYLRAGLDCSASWRGYMATWEVRDDKLWLVGLTFAPCSDQAAVPIAVLYPSAIDGVVADWVSGQMRVTIGPWIRDAGKYGHFAAYWDIVIDKGVVVSRRRVDESFSP